MATNKKEKKNLDQRFKEFLHTLQEVENIDNLVLTNKQRDSNKADYFIKNRQLIIELKSLETDTEYKIEKILEPHRLRPEFPDFYDGWEIHKILKHLPDGDEINRQLADAVTSSLEEIYRKANKQIRTTKTTFGLPSSQGLLIVLNERVNVLTPEHIIYKLRKTLRKKHPNGDFQFPQVNYVLVLSEAHFSSVENEIMAFPIIHLPVGIICEFQHKDAVDFIVQKWTEFNDIPYLDGGEVNSLHELKLRSVSRHLEDSKTSIPRHESWRRHYRRNPYFRSYDDKKMLWMFKMIMSELTPGFLKGANQRQHRNTNFWIEIFTHFLEEVNHRGTDMRFFAPVMKELGKDIEEEMNKRFPNL